MVISFKPENNSAGRQEMTTRSLWSIIQRFLVNTSAKFLFRISLWQKGFPSSIWRIFVHLYLSKPLPGSCMHREHAFHCFIYPLAKWTLNLFTLKKKTQKDPSVGISFYMYSTADLLLVIEVVKRGGKTTTVTQRTLWVGLLFQHPQPFYPFSHAFVFLSGDFNNHSSRAACFDKKKQKKT